MEANPKSGTDEMIKELVRLGVTRFSVGMQAFDQRFLKALDRIHSLEEGKTFLQNLSKSKNNFSIDLMLGLPFSEAYRRDIITELKMALDHEPKHLSLYILTTKENYCHRDHLPSEEYIADEYLKVAEYLKSQGLNHYEVSNFSQPGFECQHNLKYWQSESVAALGPSGTGFLNFENKKGLRYKWKNKEMSFSQENLDQEALNLEKIYLSLRTKNGISLTNNSLKSLSCSWEKRNLGIRKEDWFHLNSNGFLILDSLMNEIFAHPN